MNILKNNVKQLENFEDLVGKTIVGVEDWSIGEHVNVMFVTDDNCLLHIHVENNWGDCNVTYAHYESEYQKSYKYRGGSSSTDFLEKHNMINTEYRDILTKEYEEFMKKQKKHEYEQLKKKLEKLEKELGED